MDVQTLKNYLDGFQFKETFFENYIAQIIEEKTDIALDPMDVEEIEARPNVLIKENNVPKLEASVQE